MGDIDLPLVKLGIGLRHDPFFFKISGVTAVILGQDLSSTLGEGDLTASFNQSSGIGSGGGGVDIERHRSLV